MPSIGVSLSFPMHGDAQELFRFLMRDEGLDPDDDADVAAFTGVLVRECLFRYRALCQLIEHYGLDVLIDNADKVKADTSSRGHTWVLLAKDIAEVAT